MRLASLCSECRAEPVDQSQRRHADEERDYPLGGKCPGEAHILDPRRDIELQDAELVRHTSAEDHATYWIGKGTEVQQHRIEGDHAHALERIAVHDVSCDHGIPDLNAGGD